MPKISELPDISEIEGDDIFAVVRHGSPNRTYSVSANEMAVFFGSSGGGLALTKVLLDTSPGPLTYTLPAVPLSPDQVIVVADFSGNALNNNVTIIGAGPPIRINQNYGSVSFLWGATRWVAF
jgi:hypothetical protein